MEALAVVVGAGSSTRLRARARKPLIELAGRPVLERACEPFQACAGVAHVVLVVHADDLETVRGWAAARPTFGKVRAVLAGGAERADSVRLGVRAPGVPGDVDLICVHDAARPFVRPEAVERCLAAAERDGAALLAVPVRDTLKRSEDGEHATRTVDREGLWAAQTPQAFEAARFRSVLAEAERDGFRPTDDAALWERYVGPVTIVPGDPRNLKLTGNEDLELARALLALEGASGEESG